MVESICLYYYIWKPNCKRSYTMIMSITITSIRTIIYIFYYYWSKPCDPSGGVSIRGSANAWKLWT